MDDIGAQFLLRRGTFLGLIKGCRAVHDSVFKQLLLIEII
jgi:hypothetical protein